MDKSYLLGGVPVPVYIAETRVASEMIGTTYIAETSPDPTPASSGNMFLMFI